MSVHVPLSDIVAEKKAGGPRRIAIVTDAWAPQVNGVVRTLRATIGELEARGHTVLVISPDRFASLPCPTYPEIRLALATRWQVGRLLDAFGPSAVHIATEGPLGLAARCHCRRRGWRFTTAYHTQFPAYVAKRTHLPERWFWRYVRWFHAPAEQVMVATASIRAELAAHGMTRVHGWSRGVDLEHDPVRVADAPRTREVQPSRIRETPRSDQSSRARLLHDRERHVRVRDRERVRRVLLLGSLTHLCLLI